MSSFSRHWRPLDLRQLGGREQDPHTGHPGPMCGSLGAVVNSAWPTREQALKGRRWQTVKAKQWPTSPPQPNADVTHLLSMLMAELRLGTPRKTPLVPLVVMPLLGRLNCLSSSSTMRCSVSRTTTQRQWSRRALSICPKG